MGEVLRELAQRVGSLEQSLTPTGLDGLMDLSRRISAGLAPLSADEIRDWLAQIEALTSMFRDVGRALEALRQLKARLTE